MKTVLAVILVAVCILTPIHAATPDQWRSRTIYQLLTDRFARSSDNSAGCASLSGYCGGTFRGIANHLDYIAGLGMDAIWISPIVVNYQGGYHGYWATDLFNVNANFGSAQDLHDLVSAAHAKGMYVMVDVVANHVGPVSDVKEVAPFNDAAHYHNCNSCPPGCSISDYTNSQQVEVCRLSGLPDLNQTNAYVASTLLAWVKDLTSTYKLDGLRIDTIPEVAGSSSSSLAGFLKQFQSAAGVYTVGEVFDSRIPFVASYQGLIDGVLSYPLAFTLRGVFQNHNSMNDIQSTLQQYKASFKDTGLLGTFIDNHDNARFLNGQGDYKLYENALAYTLLSDGIPIIYYGSEQGFNGGNDPNNREVLWTTEYSTSSQLYQFISTVAAFRKKAAVWNFPQVQRYSDDTFYAFTRGTTFVALTNGGSNQGQLSRTITYHPYANGAKLCNLFYPTQDCVKVVNGQFTVNLNNGEAKVYYPTPQK